LNKKTPFRLFSAILAAKLFANPTIMLSRWIFVSGIIQALLLMSLEPTGFKLKQHNATNFAQWRENRKQILQRIPRACSESKQAKILCAYLFGKTLLPSKEKKRFQSNGIIHLVTPSALHLGIIARFSYSSAAATLAFLFKPIHLKIMQIGLSVVSALLYYILCGQPESIARALTLLILLLICSQFFGKTSFENILLTSLGGFLWITPEEILCPSFLLSSSAYGALCCSKRIIDRYGLKNWGARLCIIQLAMSVFLWPILFYLNLPFEFKNILSNLIAIPTVTLLLFPASILFSTSSLVHENLGQLFLIFGSLLNRWLFILLEEGVGWSFAGICLYFVISVFLRAGRGCEHRGGYKIPKNLLMLCGDFGNLSTHWKKKFIEMVSTLNPFQTKPSG
jgi:ComEC/Rec2-related protein